MQSTEGIKTPHTNNNETDRIPIRLPLGLVEEVDRIIKKYNFYGNRQQFVEFALREKIEKVRSTEAKLPHEAKKHP